MIKKTLTYHGLEDERGNQEEYIEDFWFHISEANLRKIVIIDGEGIEEKIARLFRTNNRRAIYEFIEEFIDMSYGIRHEDGKQFVQTKEVLEAFKNTDAYGSLMTDLLSSEESITKFLMGILPAKYSKEYQEYQEQKPEEVAASKERLSKATGVPVEHTSETTTE